MPVYLTPGVYYEATDAAERRISALRTDIAGFVGVAAKGPVGEAVRIESWRQFEAVFGGLHPDAFLGYAVKAFFENGGRACHVVRAAAPVAEATVPLGSPQPDDGRSSLIEPAGFVQGAVVTVTQEDAPVQYDHVLAAVEPLSRRLVWQTALEPELWLDRPLIFEGRDGVITLGDDRARQPDGRLASIVQSVAGFATGDRVRVRQPDRTRRRNHRLAGIEAGGARLVWEEPLAGHFDLTRPLRFATGAAAADTVFANHLGEPLLRVAAAHPGAWGNTLRVLLTIGRTGATRTGAAAQPEDRVSSVVTDVSGYQRGDLVRAFQLGARPDAVYLVVAGVDPGRRRLIWRDIAQADPASAALVPVLQRLLPDGFDLREPITFERVDFGLSVYADGRLREVFPSLSLVPEHPRYAPLVVSAGAGNLIAVTPIPETLIVEAAQFVPAAAGRWLEGGRDGLAALTADDLFGSRGGGGLAALERVDEVAILVTPDAHLRPGPEQVTEPEPPPVLDPCSPCRPLEEPAPPPPPSPVERAPAFTAEDTFRIQAAMLDQCERLRDRFAVLDPPDAGGAALQQGVTEVRAWRKRFDSVFGGLYFPWVLLRDPRRRGPLRAVPPGGHVAGLYARFDLAEGVHRPPANGALESVHTVSLPVDDALHGVLNPEGINAIRAFPGRGVRVYGARTVSSDPLWRYVNVRRLLSMVEEAIEESMQWAVFAPNDIELRELLRLGISALLEAIWQRGALVGATPEEAFFVRCDDTNNPPSLPALGQLVVDVGVAPSVPAEFVVFRVGRTQDELQVTELGARLTGAGAAQGA